MLFRSHALDGNGRLGVSPQWIGTEPGDDSIAVICDADGAVGRPGQVDGGERRLHPHAYLADHRWRIWTWRHSELTEQSEVNVTDLARVPPIKQMLAVGLETVQYSSVETSCIVGEATLRRRNSHRLTNQQPAVILGDSVNGVAFRHDVESLSFSKRSHYGGPVMKLQLNDAELASCVGCGLCLPHCPTYRVTGEESLSPRGRIAAMRTVAWDGGAADDAFVDFMETCVQCRGCEPACPSGVPYGRLIEGTRQALAQAHRSTPRWQRAGFMVLGRHRLLLVGSSILALAQRLHVVPARLGLTQLPIRRGPRVQPTGSDVFLFTGCVMDAWQRATHRATQRVVESASTSCATAARGGDCCGALHTHAGLTKQARRLATRTMASMPGDAPILVNSAGCGAAMKDYGHLLDTDAARAFSARVLDVHEWLAARISSLPPPDTTRPRPSVIVQDPCHLRHVQRTHSAVRTVLARYANVIELDDDGLCCGAGGAYSALQPQLACDIRARKLAAIERAAGSVGDSLPGAQPAVVASANPGCAMHLRAGGATVMHPLDIVDELIS